MQIILLERVAGLGNLGDVVTVKNGYARNFLIPTAKAKRATEANLKEFEERRAELEAKQAAVLADAQAGRLFGSVTNADIADAIKANGIEVVKANVRLPEGPFKAVGEYTVEVALHADAVATITVVVAAAAAQ